MNNLGLIVVFIFAAFFGVLGGVVGSFFFKKFVKIRERKDLQKFINGKKTNNYNMDDGKKINVDTFQVPGEGQGNSIITLKGGVDIKHGIEKNNSKTKKKKLNKRLSRRRKS